MPEAIGSTGRAAVDPAACFGDLPAVSVRSSRIVQVEGERQCPSFDS